MGILAGKLKRAVGDSFASLQSAGKGTHHGIHGIGRAWIAWGSWSEFRLQAGFMKDRLKAELQQMLRPNPES
jgi:hypothetical protein